MKNMKTLVCISMWTLYRCMGENQAHTTNQRTPTIIDSHLDFYTFPSMHPSNHPSKQATNQPSIHSPCSSDPPCTYLGATSFPRIFLGSVVRKTATRTPTVSPCWQPHYCVDWPHTAWGSQFSPPSDHLKHETHSVWCEAHENSGACS